MGKMTFKYPTLQFRQHPYVQQSSGQLTYMNFYAH